MARLLLISPLKNNYMDKSNLTGLYDIMVYLTFYYDDMPEKFKSRFPKAFCLELRKDLFNNFSNE